MHTGNGKKKKKLFQPSFSKVTKYNVKLEVDQKTKKKKGKKKK